MVERLKLLKSKAEAERVIMREGYRITVPARFRQRLGTKVGSVFEIRVEDERLILEIIRR